MAAKTKSDLITITQTEYQKLLALIEKIDVETAMQKHDEDTSIKDVIAHRAHWIELFFGWYWDGQKGKDVYFPAQGYKWNDLKRYNAALRAKQSGLVWEDAVAELDAAKSKLLAFFDDRSEEELYGAPMKGAKNNWPPGRWAEAAGPSHFRSAAKYIRAVLRDRK
ncbi:MAG: ClbS/DfsB family four-helix bundle protein [Pseudomonadota bacterium]|nr:ClbS/DfsB family four-helix bundle protein [Pseudomonadota bacterium]